MKEVKGCRKCGCKNSKVVDSRFTPDGLIVRRRKCKECSFRWSTIEVDYWEYIWNKGDKDDPRV